MNPNRDEVLRMAREAGMSFEVFPDGYCDAVDVPRGTVSYIDCVSFEHIDRFAALVAAKERETCAQIAEEWLGPAKDRELHIAAAIRARSTV